MSKTIKSVLEELQTKSIVHQMGVHYGRLDVDGRNRNMQDDLIEALSDIESIIKEQVIGENLSTRNLESPEWNIVGGQNELRNKQSLRLLKALGRGDK